MRNSNCFFCFLKAKQTRFSLFKAVVYKIWLRILIMTNKYSWENWDQRKSLDDQEIQIIKI